MESEALMGWWLLPIIIGACGFVSLLLIIVLHLIEEKQNGRF